jgi:hypothetical protein
MLALTVWVAAIILQSALLGRNMYGVSDHQLVGRPTRHHTQWVLFVRSRVTHRCVRPVCLPTIRAAGVRDRPGERLSKPL